MAATCAHILANVSETQVPTHSRDISTISSATLHTNTTVHSHPTEPLLRPTTPHQIGQSYNVSSHLSRSSGRSLRLPQWSQSHIMNHHHSPVVVTEKGFNTGRKPLARIKLLRWIKNVLAIVMALWAVYNTVRYLLAFCIYVSITGQALSLAMAAITGLSFALICCATILGFVQPHLLAHGFPVQTILTMRSVMQHSASCCLLGPSIVNFILVFAWKKTTDLELQTRHRCRLDVDLIWSPSFSLCNHKTRTWGLWLTLSVIRLVVTLIIIITFHFIVSSTHITPARRTKSRQSRQKKAHNRLESYLTPLIPGNDHSRPSAAIPHLSRDSGLPCQSSDSTLSTKTSPRNRLRPGRSRLLAFSEDDIQCDYSNLDFLPMNGDDIEPGGGSDSLVGRFRSLISQITRETEDGIAFARSEASGSSHNTVNTSPSQGSPDLNTEATTYLSDHQANYDHEDDFYITSTAQTLGPYEQHQQYPADEEIQILNGFIKRMPTIESMGSRELRSSMGTSSINRDRERNGASSRPPTRNTLGSLVGTDFSGTNSQGNSLTAQAEILAGIHHSTEIGELIRRGDTIRKVDSPSTHSKSLGASTGSSSVLSYFTAPGSIAKSLVIPSSDSDPPSLPETPIVNKNSRRQHDVVDMDS